MPLRAGAEQAGRSEPKERGELIGLAIHYHEMALEIECYPRSKTGA